MTGDHRGRVRQGTRIVTYRRAVGDCPTCGKRVQRSFHAHRTVGAFASSEGPGTATRAWTRADLDAEARAWVPDFEHPSCREARGELTYEHARQLATRLRLTTPSRLRQALVDARGAYPDTPTEEGS
jgi:hypothetical protein